MVRGRWRPLLACALCITAAAPAAVQAAEQRAFELVSPADGRSYDVFNQYLFADNQQSVQSRRTTSDGAAVVYELRVNGTLPGMAIDGDANDPIVGRRTAGGWTWIAPLADRTTCSIGNETGYGDLAADASRLLFLPWCSDSVVTDGGALSPIDPLTGQRLDQERKPLYTADIATDRAAYVSGRHDATGPVPRVDSAENTYLGGNADLSTVYFLTGAQLTPDANVTRGIYRWREGTTRPLFMGFDGVPAAGGDRLDRRNVVAGADADIVTASIIQGLSADDADGTRDVYQSSGEETTRISRTEFTGPPETPVDKLFEGGSAGGSIVFFSTTEKLVGDGVSGGDLDASQDIYAHDAGKLAGARLALVSAADPSCATTLPNPCNANADNGGATDISTAKFAIASDDGRRVFFVTGDILNPDDQDLQQSLYVRDVSAGTTSYVAPAGAGVTWMGDGLDAGPLVDGSLVGERRRVAVRPIALSDDGLTAAFLLASDVSLPADHGGADVDGTRDLYVWTAADGLRRVRQGVVADANTTTVPSVGTNLGDGQQPQLGRAITPDGGTVFFQTRDRLVARDTNDRLDVYVYDTAAHDVELISPGDSDSDAVYFDASASGDDIFLLTAQALDAARDTDRGHVDLYDARVGGGFPAPPTPPVCDALGDGCQGPIMPLPVRSRDWSSTLTGPGNFDPGPLPPNARPRITMARLTANQRRALARGRRVTVRVRSTTAARVTASLRTRPRRRWLRSSSVSEVLDAGGALRLAVQLSRGARRQLSRAGRLDAQLVVRSSRSAQPLRSTFVLRSPGAGRHAHRTAATAEGGPDA